MKIGKFSSSELTKAMENILDTFSGVDGGVSYVMFCNMIKDLDDEAINGDINAKKLTDIVRQFSKLINIANGRLK